VSIPELVLEVHATLEGLGAEHAFGGALALAYYAEPRATVDVDVNVFVPFVAAAEVVEAFHRRGLAAEGDPAGWLPTAGVRLTRPGELGKVDLFFSLDDSYERIAARVRKFPFGRDGGPQLPFLSAEDLAVFKLSFGRDKDWIDLKAMVQTVPDIDLSYIEQLLIGLRGPSMFSRLARFRALVDSESPGLGDVVQGCRASTDHEPGIPDQTYE